jgi:hypothetical protein
LEIDNKELLHLLEDEAALIVTKTKCFFYDWKTNSFICEAKINEALAVLNIHSAVSEIYFLHKFPNVVLRLFFDTLMLVKFQKPTQLTRAYFQI